MKSNIQSNKENQHSSKKKQEKEFILAVGIHLWHTP